MPHRTFRRRVTRRSFVGGSIVAATAMGLPRGGAFAGGGDTIRVGVVGCGGRGTGAALQLAAADRGVVITALGGLFADEVAAAADRLAARAGGQFVCPVGGRFAGPGAAEHVIHSDVDAVVLATPPHVRPVHLAATVAAGRHVYCETPAAVDAAGAVQMLATGAEAARRGLSVVAGLRWRRDAATAETIARIRDGAVGRVLGAAAVASAGPSWRRNPLPHWTAAETRMRNWIADDRLSGGPLVEHHIHAIDRALWAFGDASPAAAVGIHAPAQLPPPRGLPRAASARLYFADGRWIDVSIDRRAGIETGASESVHGTRGTADLLGRVVAGRAVPCSAEPTDPLALAAAALVRALRTGERIDDLPILCRSTLAAVMARMACSTTGPVRWGDVGIAGTAHQSLRPLQWEAV